MEEINVSEDKTGYGRQDGIRGDGSSSGHDEHSTDISDFRVDTGVRLLHGADGGLNPRKAGLRPVGS